MKKFIVWLLTVATLLLSLTSLSLVAMAEEPASNGTTAQAESSDTEKPTSIDLYLIAGQSNAQGTSKITDRDAAYELAPELENGYSNVLYAGKAGLTSSYEFDWVPVTLDLGKGEGYIGPEAGMAISLSKNYTASDRVAGIIKYAHGGSRLSGNDVDGEVANWVSPSYAAANGWEYGGSGTGKITGGHYRKFLEVFRQKVELLIADGYTDINIKGLYWMQGEGDRQDAEAEYVSALSYLISDLRTDLSATMKEIYNATDDGGAQNMPFFIGAISETYLWNTSNRKGLNQKIIRAQKQVVAQTENCYFIDNSQYKISEFDEIHKTAIALGSDTGHWSQADMLSIGQTVGEQMYLKTIEIPDSYASAETYPFLLIKNGKVINAGKSWSSVSGLAKTALAEDPGATVTVLLRRDHTITGAPSTGNRLCFMNGTLVVDLGGHTLTTDTTFLGAALPDTYTDNYTTTCVVKNGTILLGKGAAFITQNSGGKSKTISTVFENITFGAATTLTRDQLFQSSGDLNVVEMLNLLLTLNDCTIDLTTYDFTTLEKVFKIFNFKKSGIQTNIEINGGSIKANTWENITWANLLASNDTLTFGKSEMSREYTKLILPKDYALPELGGTNDEGKAALFGGNGVADGDTVTYSLFASVTTDYGTIDATYADPDTYPFAIFVDGKFNSATSTWANAFETARAYLAIEGNAGKTVNVLLRKNYTNGNGLGQFGLVMGNVVLDLGGHTMLRSKTIVELGTAGMTATEAAVPASILIKNGKLLARNTSTSTTGGILAYQVANEYSKVMDVTFDNVTIAMHTDCATYAEKGYPLYAMIATVWGEKTGSIDSDVTFRNCTFDFTGSTGTSVPSETVYLLANASGGQRPKTNINVIFDGGMFEGAIANVALTNMDSSDSVKFINSGNGYTSYQGVTGIVDSSVAYDTDNGTMYFGMTAKKTASGVTTRTYELGYQIKDYGIAPYSVYSDPDTHPFIIFRNGYYTSTLPNWSKANAYAIELCTKESDTVVMLLRKSIENTSGAAKNPSSVKGTVILDLGGNTFSTTKTMFEAIARHTHDSTFKIVDGTIVNKRPTNGALIAFNRNSIDDLGDGTYTGTANKNFHFIFENVKIELGDSTNTALTTITWRTLSDATTETLNAYVTFNDCTFDLTKVSSEAAELRLFHAQESGQSYIDVHFTVNGGQILANDLSNVTVFQGNTDDSFTFGKGTDGAYTSFKLSATETAPTTPFDTAEGIGYFYNAGNGLYRLGIGRAKITGASLNLGADLSMNYYVRIHDVTLSIEELAMQFTVAGKSVTVTEYTTEKGEYVFTLSGIAPQQIADDITATLLCGEDVINEKSEYSIKDNLLSLNAKSAAVLEISEEKLAALKTLIADVLAYGQAAQDYTGYAPDAPILNGSEEIVGSTVTPDESDDMILTDNIASKPYFKSATVNFNTVNEIRIRIYVGHVDASLVTVKVDGESYKLSDLQNLGGGDYLVTIPEILATELDTVHTVTLVYDGVDGASLSYSASAYAYAMQESGKAEMKALALALYRYGASADAYAEIA